MGNAKEVLYQLIEQRLEPGADIAAIDEKIWEMFGETWTVLCTDMTGFTRRTDQFGITHFLTLIFEMQRMLKPIALEHNGHLIKDEADNLFIIFREPLQAVNCAIDMNRATTKYNMNKDADHQIVVSIGIGHGQILKIGDEDCWGSEVNRSFKLGEDIAKGGEILLTPSAYQTVRDLIEFKFSLVENSPSELIASYYRLEYRKN